MKQLTFFLIKLTKFEKKKVVKKVVIRLIYIAMYSNEQKGKSL